MTVRPIPPCRTCSRFPSFLPPLVQEWFQEEREEHRLLLLLFSFSFLSLLVPLLFAPCRFCLRSAFSGGNASVWQSVSMCEDERASKTNWGEGKMTDERKRIMLLMCACLLAFCLVPVTLPVRLCSEQQICSSVALIGNKVGSQSQTGWFPDDKLLFIWYLFSNLQLETEVWKYFNTFLRHLNYTWVIHW